MKKLLAAIITGILIVSLSACNGAGTESVPGPESTSGPESVAESKSIAEAESVAESESIAESESTAETESEAGPVVGAYTRTESPVVTDEIREVVKKATADLTGAEYIPVAYIEKQVVAGMNYCILCKITPVVPDAISTYAIVHIYEDLNGNAEIIDLEGSEAVPEADISGEVGGWSEPDTVALTDEAINALEKVQKGSKTSYEPVALLATQVVSGTNYSILCKNIDSSSEYKSTYSIVHVYEDLQGNAEITETYDFIIDS